MRSQASACHETAQPSPYLRRQGSPQLPHPIHRKRQLLRECNVKACNPVANHLKEFAMNTIKKWVEDGAGGEAIEAFVIGSHYDYDDDDDDGSVSGKWAGLTPGTLYSWDDAVPHLTAEFDVDWGGPRNPPFTAWTKSWVIFCWENDGATGWCRLPRHPQGHKPEFNGQSYD